MLGYIRLPAVPGKIEAIRAALAAQAFNIFFTDEDIPHQKSPLFSTRKFWCENLEGCMLELWYYFTAGGESPLS
jgi:hypothetical protein